MELTEFAVGETFWTDAGSFCCTDIGTRVVVAINVGRTPSPAPRGSLASGSTPHEWTMNRACWMAQAPREASEVEASGRLEVFTGDPGEVV